MSNWLATILAVVIAGILFLALQSLYRQTQDRSVAATQLRAARSAELDLLSMIEIDFNNIGSNHPSYELHPDSAILFLGSESPDSVFRFLGQAARGAPPVVVEYRWRTDGTIETARGIVNVYRISRVVDGTLSGVSSGYVTRFDISLLATDGSAVLSNDLTRQVHVGISLVSALGQNDYVEEHHYNTIVRPQALARLDYEDYIPS